MAAIFAQMQGNQIGPGLLGAQRRGNRVRIRGVPLLPQGGNVIDIDA